MAEIFKPGIDIPFPENKKIKPNDFNQYPVEEKVFHALIQNAYRDLLKSGANKGKLDFLITLLTQVLGGAGISIAVDKAIRIPRHFIETLDHFDQLGVMESQPNVDEEGGESNYDDGATMKEPHPGVIPNP